MSLAVFNVLKDYFHEADQSLNESDRQALGDSDPARAALHDRKQQSRQHMRGDRKAAEPMRRAAKGRLRMTPQPLRFARRVGFADWAGFDTPKNSHMGKGRAAGPSTGGFAVRAAAHDSPNIELSENH